MSAKLENMDRDECIQDDCELFEECWDEEIIDG